jgi:predicted Zn-dependent protease
MNVRLVMLMCCVALPISAEAQFGQLGKALGKAAEVQQDLSFSDAEEGQLGTAISTKLRDKYGVVQDKAVHKYVTLVGSVLASASSRPHLKWTFVVLDTGGVNAFAAPGGFVHITRGALALIQNEAELAGVLAHELVHVTEKHTIRAMQKNKALQIGVDEKLSGNAALLNKLAEGVYLDIVEKGFGRAEEHESDEKGLALANQAGYAPQGLGQFLTHLQERNKDSKEKRGLFASHPETKERLDRLTKQIAAQKLTATVTLPDRYKKFVTYKPVPIAQVAVVEAGTAGVAGATEKPAATPAAKPEEKKEEPKKRGFGLGRLLPTGGSENKSAQASASGGARMVDPERDAKGGSNPKPVPVTIVAADLAAFKKEGGLR